jgi:hypothetical protein
MNERNRADEWSDEWMDELGEEYFEELVDMGEGDFAGRLFADGDDNPEETAHSCRDTGGYSAEELAVRIHVL